MNIKIYILQISLITSICFFVSCNPTKNTEKNVLTEGLIEYKTIVIDSANPLADFAPSRSILSFKGNNIHVEMSVMGVLNTSFVTNIKNRTLTQIVSFLDIKSACVQSEKDLINENKNYELTFQETNDVKFIAGYKCKKVIATMVNDSSNKFDVYYTNELGKDSVNFIGPYHSIKGMLMQYRMKKLGLELCFTASVVKKINVDDETFKIPSKYKIISRSEMDNLFKDFQN